MKKILLFVCFLFIQLNLQATQLNISENTPQNTSANKAEKINVFIYLDATDKDISPEQFSQIVNFEKGLALYPNFSENINFFVEAGGINSRVLRYKLKADKTDHKSISSPILMDRGYANMSSWRELVSFVEWGTKISKADRNIFIINSHGSHFYTTRDGTLLWDHKFLIPPADPRIPLTSSVSNLNMHEFTFAVSKIKKVLGKNLDIMLFDACSQANLEMLGQAYGTINYYVSSARPIASSGISYIELFKPILENKHVNKILYYLPTIKYDSETVAGVYNNNPFSVYKMKDFPQLASAMKNYLIAFDQLNPHQKNIIKNTLINDPRCLAQHHERKKDQPIGKVSAVIKISSFISCVQTSSALVGLSEASEIRQSALILKKEFDKFISNNPNKELTITYFPEIIKDPIVLHDYKYLRFDRFVNWSQFMNYMVN